jgi:hypothetical protein
LANSTIGACYPDEHADREIALSKNRTLLRRKKTEIDAFKPTPWREHIPIKRNATIIAHVKQDAMSA